MEKSIKVVVIMIIVVVLMIATLGLILLVKNNPTKTKENAMNNNTKISNTVEKLKVNGKDTPYVLYPANGISGGALCRVLYDTNSENGLQIITVNPVDTVVLGAGDKTVTPDSWNDEYVALKSFNNAVQLLNKQAEKFIDTKGIAKDARCVGSNPKDKNNEPENYVGEYEYLNTYKINGNYKKGDGNYYEDEEQLKEIGAFNISNNAYKGYWLASRSVSVDSAYATFWMRYVEPMVGYNGNTKGNETAIDLWYISSLGDIHPAGASYGLRPVFILNIEKVKITSGAGTENNPYILDVYNGEDEQNNNINLEYNYDNSKVDIEEQIEPVYDYVYPNTFMDLKDDRSEYITFLPGRDEVKSENGANNYCEIDASKAPTLRFKTVAPLDAEIMYNGTDELGLIKGRASWTVRVIRKEYSSEDELNEMYIRNYNENKAKHTVLEETKLVLNGIEWDVFYASDEVTAYKYIYCSTKQGNSGFYLVFMYEDDKEINKEYCNNFIGYMTLTD